MGKRFKQSSRVVKGAVLISAMAALIVSVWFAGWCRVAYATMRLERDIRSCDTAAVHIDLANGADANASVGQPDSMRRLLMQLLHPRLRRQASRQDTMLGVALAYAPRQLNTITSRRLKRLQIVTDLLDHGANPTAPAFDSLSPLTLAVCNDDVEALELLLRHRADPNGDEYRRSRLPWRPDLITAVYNRRPTIVKLLLEHGANVDVADVLGRTGLMLAVTENVQTCAALLVSYGANPNVRDKYGHTAAYYLSDKYNAKTKLGISQHDRAVLLRFLSRSGRPGR